MWMSEARALKASTITWLASRMTALSCSSTSEPLASCSFSACASAPRSDRMSLMLARAPPVPSPPAMPRNCWMSFLRPTASWILCPRMTWWIESTRWMSWGLSMRTIVVPSLSLERQPEVPLEELQLEVLHEVGRRDDPLVELDERHPVELAQRRPQLALRDPVLVQQDRLDVGVLVARGGDGGVDVVLAHQALGEQVVELGAALGAELLLVVEGDAERLGDAGDVELVILGEAAALLLVQQLDHADHEPVLVQDRHAEDLRGAVPGLLVPRRVEAQLGADLGDLAGVVGVRDVDGLAAGGHEARHRALVDRNPDLLDGVEGEELGVELLLLYVHHVERHAVGVEEGEDVALDLDEDRVEGLRGVDPIDQVDELLLVGQPFLQHQDRFLDRQSASPVAELCPIILPDCPGR